ncbi:molybdenum cofactor cytidylyltransferase [Natranaerovirga hydrolytica]|uniref:Molybdenum cofactor cytidylyltransferase n=1 Tax=Natranaerovirga hydrolytica TaxID=680378 RepID=A0A4R1MWY0_9FIRM|nr:nucleotidyltransferase family protein [Natranaerovirga hydrolytica]TCK97747.1 molybdenum cofactor cytidylyltransferase [Natranaerovirga hydrolytica]
MAIEGVILAAGFSSRANAFKMALDFDGRSILQRNIESMYPYCQRMIVVGGYKIDKIKDLTASYNKVEVVFNTDYEKGMFSSVKKGVACVKAEKFFFTPGDYPLITDSILQGLLNAQGQVIIPMFQGRKGHPIMMTKEMIPKILKEPVESNLKVCLQKESITLVEVQEKGILLDVDTMEDYHKAKAYYNKKKNKH